jgi:kinesin family member C2/C3
MSYNYTELQSEIRRLEAELETTTIAKSTAQKEALEVSKRLSGMKQVAKATKAAVQKQYEHRLATLQQTIHDQKQQIAEDDEIMEALHARIEVLEAGSDKNGGGQTPVLVPSESSDSSLNGVTEKLEQVEQHYSQAQARIQQLQNQLRAQKNATNPQLESMEAEIARLREQLAQQQAEDAQLERTNEERDELQSKCKSLQDALDTVTAQNAALQEAHDLLQLEFDSSTSKQAELEQDIIEWKQQADELSAAKDDAIELREKCLQADEQIAKLQSQIQDSETAAAKDKAMEQLTEELNQVRKQYADSKTECISLRTHVQESEKKCTSLEELIRNLDTIVKRKDEEMAAIKVKAKSKLSLASKRLKELSAENVQQRKLVAQHETQHKALSARLQHAEKTGQQKLSVLQGLIKNQAATARNTIAELRTAQQSLTQQVQISIQQWTQSPGTVAMMQQAIEQQIQARVSGAVGDISKRYIKERLERRRLLNVVHELKGNIRVYCRVRPMSDAERKKECDTPTIQVMDDGQLKVHNSKKDANHEFEYEQLFDTNTTQSQVFDEVSDLITSVTDGYNVCIFAYGQTGSGKTYTMNGPPSNPGVNQRALHALFENAAQRSDEIKYDIQVSLLEIYNEKIRDLLSPTSRPRSPGSDNGVAGLKVVQGKNGMEVVGLSKHIVSSPDQVNALLTQGSRNRSVGTTDMNAHSSRSHLVLSVYVTGHDTVYGKTINGKLHLIDLAGSERISRSHASGQRLKEAQSINSSLSSLGICIAARANKKSHVPYRNSTLTYLLQDSLSKNSKTLMFVQISPAAEDVVSTYYVCVDCVTQCMHVCQIIIVCCMYCVALVLTHALYLFPVT